MSPKYIVQNAGAVFFFSTETVTQASNVSQKLHITYVEQIRNAIPL